LNRHRIPAAAVHPVDAKPGNEIRLPAQTGCPAVRAQKEVKA